MTIDDYIVSEDSTLLETLEKINRNTSRTAFVCSGKKLLAAVSDGDIRRALIKGMGTDSKVREIANYSPLSLSISQKHVADKYLRERFINAVPLLNVDGEIVDVKVLLKDSTLQDTAINVPLVIMAGGKGTRLKPYTDILPKPLIPIGEKTITEHIMDRFLNQGCSDIFMIVNYKKEFIKAYFTEDIDGNQKYTPSFVEEKEFLGTGGGISLLKGIVKSTFFMTNCDILIDADYSDILENHRKSNNIITMVCAKRKITIPYGTVETDQNGKILALKEKPEYEMITNTGFYVIEPEFLNKVPTNTKVDITDIIEKCISEKENVGTYLVDESDWMDMGQLEEMEKMKEKLEIQ